MSCLPECDSATAAAAQIVADLRGLSPAPLRSDTNQAMKDLAQAHALIAELAEDRPGELAEAYWIAKRSGPKWRDAVARSLRQRPEIKGLLADVS